MNTNRLRNALIKKLAHLKKHSGKSKDWIISYIPRDTAYVGQEYEMVFRIKPAVRQIQVTHGK